jgi:hypothetical protein
MSLPAPSGDDCKNAQLKMRIKSVTVNKNGGQYYCILTATDGAHSEAALTDLTKDLGDGVSNAFDPSVGLFWGQKDLVDSANNVTVTYKCYLSKKGLQAWSDALKAMGDSAMQNGGNGGQYGWAFGIGSAAADAAAAAAKTAAANDDERLVEQQTIDRTMLLGLTNGRTWDIHKSRKNVFGGVDYELTLTVESWGCADFKGGAGG